MIYHVTTTTHYNSETREWTVVYRGHDAEGDFPMLTSQGSAFRLDDAENYARLRFKMAVSAREKS